MIVLIFSITLCNTFSSSSSISTSRDSGVITEFEGGTGSKSLVFESKGNDSSLVLSLPESSKIESASIDIEGKEKVKLLEPVINFSDTKNNKAWDDPANMEYPVSSAPSKFKNNAFSSDDYADIREIDKEAKHTFTDYAGEGYPVQIFEFDLSDHPYTSFSSIEIYWRGGFLHYSAPYADLDLYIWDIATNSWAVVGSYSQQSGFNNIYEHNISRSFTDYLDYINETTNILNVLLSGPYGGGMNSCGIYTDYIGINLTGDPIVFTPKNPYLNIGSDEDIDWTFNGNLSTKMTFSGNDFVDELQEHLDTGPSFDDKVYVIFEFGVESAGVLFISNLSISYITNSGPVQILEIPSFSFDEDSGWIELGTITKYFQDPDDPLSELTFDLNGNTPHIWGEITAELELRFTSNQDYHGTAEFNVSCKDRGLDGETSSDDCIVYSNNFIIEVFPSDDPPVIEYINDISVDSDQMNFTIDEDKYLNFTVVAGDIDGDEIRYSINSNDDSISIIDDFISFLPGQEHVGFFNFTLTAVEQNMSKLSDFVNIIVLVNNTNDAPHFDLDQDRYMVYEDSRLDFSLKADDPDLGYDRNEKLTFQNNITDYNLDGTVWSFNEETGHFSFEPDNSHVGSYHLEFSVSDRYGETDSCQVSIEVSNINDPPEVNPISYEIVDTYKSRPELVSIKVNFTTEPAYDPDFIHGDVLNYTWDFDANDGIGIDASGLKSQWTYIKAGNYTITLTVSDSGVPVLTVSTNITIELVDPGEVPPTQGPDSPDGSGSSVREDIWLWIGAGASLIILIILIGLIIMRKRQVPPMDENDGIDHNDFGKIQINSDIQMGDPMTSDKTTSSQDPGAYPEQNGSDQNVTPK